MPKKIIIAGAGLDGQPVTITGLPGTPLEGQSKSVLAWGTPPATGTSLTALGGRIAVFDQAITDPSAGKVVARADGKTTLVLRDVTSAQAISAMIDGVPGQIEVSEIGQRNGFGSGEHYWLAQDGDGRFAPTPGRRHRKIYVSTSPSAMTRAMIAAHAGVSEGAVTGAWLRSRTLYGGGADMAVAWDAWTLLCLALYGRNKEPRSDWVYFERGQSYPELRPASADGDWWQGESEIHPLVLRTYGSGAFPKFAGINWTVSAGGGLRNVMFLDFESANVAFLATSNIIFEGGYYPGSDYFQPSREARNHTLKDLILCDHHRVVPKTAGALKWNESTDRISASYVSKGTVGLLGHGLLVDTNGYKPGYSFDMSTAFPQSPSAKSHGLYWDEYLDLTLRDSIISRNASCGLQCRYGGYYERILFLYNNIAFGGDAEPMGNFTTLLDSVNFGAGFKKVATGSGELATGFDLGSRKSVAIGNIVAHDADPDNPAEREERPLTASFVAYKGQPGTSSQNGMDYFYNDTQVYGWGSTPNERVAGISEAVLKTTTVQRYAATLDGAAPTVQGLVDFARQESTDVAALTRDIIAWTKARFGAALPSRATPADLVFLPDWRTEGFRWDNRRNWSTGDLPGTHVADSIDLDGNFVRFGTLTASIAALTSKGGILDVTSGKLTVGAITDAAEIRVRGSGQIVIPATTQPLDIQADSGLTQIAGAVTNLDMEVRGHAEVLLGPDCTVPAGKSLVISGQRPLVGWDGTGSATLTVAGTLEFRAGLCVGANTGKGTHNVTIGRQIVGDNFTALLADYVEQSSGSNNQLWLCDVDGLPVPGETIAYGAKHTYGAWQPTTAQVGSILSRGVAPLQRFRSGAVDDGLTEPTVNATVVLTAGAQIVTTGFGPGTHDLGGGAGTGVTYVDQGATLPAGVSLTAGKLVLTVS